MHTGVLQLPGGGVAEHGASSGRWFNGTRPPLTVLASPEASRKARPPQPQTGDVRAIRRDTARRTTPLILLAEPRRKASAPEASDSSALQDSTLRSGSKSIGSERQRRDPGRSDALAA